MTIQERIELYVKGTRNLRMEKKLLELLSCLRRHQRPSPDWRILKKKDVVYRRCICEYGTQPQVDVASEEMSELIKALLKWRRAKGAELIKARDNIIDEIADVRIMCRQMEILFQAENEVEKRIDFKVDRQRKRLDDRVES